MLVSYWASLFGCSVFCWWILFKGIQKGDPESGLTVGKGDPVYIAISLGVNPVVSGLAYPKEWIAGLFYTVFLTILAVNGWVDCKTHLVYRFYSVILITFSLLFLLFCRISGDIPKAREEELAVTIGISFGFLLLLLRFHMAGVGDVMNLFPCGIFLCMLMIRQPSLLLEALLVHYILACGIMVITNLSSFQWKGLKSKMTDRIPFVADIYGAAVVMMLLQIWDIPI